MRIRNIAWVVTASVFLLLAGCRSEVRTPQGKYDSEQKEPSRGDWVVAVLTNEPDNLTQFLYKQGASATVVMHLFEPLLILDAKSFEIQPYLARSRAAVSGDGLSFTFDIRDEAEWEPGKPITAADVEFTYKIMANPLVDAAAYRGVYAFLKEIRLDSANPRRITFITGERNNQAEFTLGDMYILPRHIYDPENLMGRYTYEQLISNPDAMRKDPVLKKFAESYMSEKYQREKGFVVGSGPYEFVEWVTTQSIKLKRRDNWWGDKIRDFPETFCAWPDVISYRIIRDQQTQITALKNQEVDVLTLIPPKDFIELKNNPAVTDNFTLSAPESFRYSYFGMNLRPEVKNRKPIFTDKRVRRAMAHLNDLDLLVNQVNQGFGTPVFGPLLPLNKREIHPTLKPIAFDLARANALLDEAGFTERDNDGVRFRMTDGKKLRMEFELLVSATSEIWKETALLFEQNAQKAGVKVNVNAMDFKVVAEKMKAHDFDMFAGVLGSAPVEPDLGQVFASESWNGGTNYPGYSNPRIDSLITTIRQELDPAKRIPMYHLAQEIIYEDQPVVFLICSKDRIAIHKRFRGADVSALRPGYKAQNFWTPRELVKFKN